MKNFFIDLLWFILVIPLVGISEHLFTMAIGWVLTFDITSSLINALLSGLYLIPLLALTMLPVICAIFFPFRTWFGVILTDVLFLLEAISCTFHTWTDWFILEQSSFDYVFKCYTTYCFLRKFRVYWILHNEKFNRKKKAKLNVQCLSKKMAIRSLFTRNVEQKRF